MGCAGYYHHHLEVGGENLPRHKKVEPALQASVVGVRLLNERILPLVHTGDLAAGEREETEEKEKRRKKKKKKELLMLQKKERLGRL